MALLTAITATTAANAAMSLREIGQFAKADTWSSKTENDQLVGSRLPAGICIGNTMEWRCDKPQRSSPRKRIGAKSRNVSRAQRSTSEAKWCAADPGSSQSVAVPDQRRTAPLRFALHRIRDTWPV